MARSLVLPVILLTLPAAAHATAITVDGSFDDWAAVTLFSDPDESLKNDFKSFSITADLGADGAPDENDTLYVRLEMWAVQGNAPKNSVTLTYEGGETDVIEVRAKSVALQGCNRCVTYSIVTSGGETYWEISVPFSKLDGNFADGDFVLEVNVATSGGNDVIPASGAITWDASTDVATPVQLLGQSAELVQGGVLVRWATGAEVKNRGFRVWKRAGRGQVPVSPLVPADGTPGTGAEYAIFDAGGRPGDVYVIEDLAEDGTRTRHPPLLARLDAPALLAPPPAPRAGPPPRVLPVRDLSDVARLGVNEEGVYVIDPAELIAAGIDPQVAVSRNLSLTHGGRPVRLLASGRALLFRAPAPRNAYDGEDAYRLEGRGAGPLAAVLRLRRTSGRGQPSFRSTLHFTGREVYDWYVGGDDPYAWRLVRPTARAVVGLAMPDPVAGADASVTVRLQGGRDLPHAYEVVLNGAVLGTARWSGKRPLEARFSAAAALLDPGGHDVFELRAAADAAAGDYVYLHDVTVAYERAFVARGDELAFSATGGRPVEVRGFTTGDVTLLDVTDPEAPVVLAVAAEAAGDGTFRLRFRDHAGGTVRYHAVAGGALRRPTVRPSRERLLHERRGADLLVVTTPALAGELEPLIELRRSQGLRVEVATVEEVADAFASGHAGPAGIRELVKEAARTWAPAPRYLLLAGQGSMDPRGLLGGADREQVPAHFEVTRGYTLRAAADAWYALDGRRITMAVGRIPASTPAELRAAVAKIVARERLPGSGRSLVIADGPRDGTAIAHVAERLAAALAGRAVDALDVATTPDAAERIDAALDDSDLLAFVGHGWISGWGWSGDLLTVDAQQRARPRAPVAVSSTCWEGNFSDSRAIALGARLVLAEGAGLSASFGPTSMLDLDDHGVLVEKVIGAMAAGAPTLGEAVRAGQQAFLDLGGDQLDSLHGYALLGDPAARSPLLP